MGFSLLEILIILLLITIVSAFTIPSFVNFFQKTQQKIIREQLIRAIRFARSEAITRGKTVILCKNKNWSEGYLVESNDQVLFYFNQTKNNGMLFIFSNEDYYNFWMMNTTISLDMIWINKDMEIVHIEKNAQPCFINCKIYSPKEKAKYVLEVNAGFVDKHKIEVGHFIEFR